jgi:hypothetical protein
MAMLNNRLSFTRRKPSKASVENAPDQAGRSPGNMELQPGVIQQKIIICTRVS